MTPTAKIFPIKLRTYLLAGLLLLLALLLPTRIASASQTQLRLAELPFSGYYVTTSEHAIEGLLFEDNQLYIYLQAHDHHEDEEKPLVGEDRVTFLKELHAFPYPDLRNYSAGVRDVYLADYGLDIDLQAIYQEVTELITPEMSPADIQNLVNNRVPSITYTEKNDQAYYLIASPIVTQKDQQYEIKLFGQEIYTFELADQQLLLQDQDGVTYEYIPGITPN